MYQELVQKKAGTRCYWSWLRGNTIALEFARKISVIGFDINARRIEMMQGS